MRDHNAGVTVWNGRKDLGCEGAREVIGYRNVPHLKPYLPAIDIDISRENPESVGVYLMILFKTLLSLTSI